MEREKEGGGERGRDSEERERAREGIQYVVFMVLPRKKLMRGGRFYIVRARARRRRLYTPRAHGVTSAHAYARMNARRRRINARC